MSNRRKFLKFGGLITSTLMLPGSAHAGKMLSTAGNRRGAGAFMKLRYRPYELQLKHVFTIANNSRTTTPVMLTEIEYDGVIGYGEASMPPYLGESHQSVAEFLSKVDLSLFSDPFEMEDIVSYIDSIATGNYAAKASVDIALHDLIGKILKQPWFKLWGLNPSKTPNTSFTIGMDTPEVVKQKVKKARDIEDSNGLQRDKALEKYLSIIEPTVRDGNHPC